MRSTIHMVAAGDYWLMCAGIRASRREWWERIARSRKLGEIPHHALTALLRAELGGGPRPSSELVAAMERAGFPKALWEAAGLWVDMVRVPPSGTWARRRADWYAPTWDATLLAHCRRSGILAEDHRRAIFHTKNPQVDRNRDRRRHGCSDIGSGGGIGSASIRCARCGSQNGATWRARLKR